MKAIKKITMILSIMALILFSGCSSNEEKNIDYSDSDLEVKMAIMEATQPKGELKETAVFTINNTDYLCSIDGKHCIRLGNTSEEIIKNLILNYETGE